MNRAAKKYYKEIKALLPVRGAHEKRFLNDVKLDIYEYLHTEPDPTYEQICGAFGDPSEVIIGYYTNIDEDYLIKQLRISRIVRIGVICIVALMVLVSIIRIGLFYKSYLDEKNAIVREVETVIEYDN